MPGTLCPAQPAEERGKKGRRDSADSRGAQEGKKKRGLQLPDHHSLLSRQMVEKGGEKKKGQGGDTLPDEGGKMRIS